MIESFVIVMFIANIIMFIWAYEKETHVELFMINAVLWLVAGVFAFQIQVPGDMAYYFSALPIFHFGFSFISITYAVRAFMTNFREQKWKETKGEEKMKREMIAARHKVKF